MDKIEHIDLTGLTPGKYDENFDMSKLPELNERLKQIRDTAKDYIVPAEKIAAWPWNDGYGINFDGMDQTQTLGMSAWAEHQTQQKLGIPSKYWDKMKDANQWNLLATNINTWLRNEDPKTKYMIRTVGGTVRAILSDRYAVMDSYDLTMGVLQTVMNINKDRAPTEKIQFSEANMTETHLYLRLLDYSKSYSIKGEQHQAGIVIRNSDYGDGALSVAMTMLRLVCMNGMIREAELRKVHIGERLSEGMYTAETRAAESRTWLLKVRDVLNGTLNNDTPFDQWISELKETTEVTIVPGEAVKQLQKNNVISEIEGDAIINAMMKDSTVAPGTAYQLMQGITATAKNLAPERRVELERFAGNPAELIKVVA